MAESVPPRQGDSRLVEDVYDRVVELIRSGQLPPEGRLHQVSLARRFGVSRTPVREALLRLEQDGLVYTVPRHGMFVRALTAHDVVQLYELRELLEPWAAQLACRRSTGADRAALTQIQREHEQHDPSFASNREFHMRLVASCGNAMTLRVLAGLWAQDSTERMYSVYRHQPSSLPQMIAEHRDIVDAFLRGEDDRVHELVRRHIASAGAVTAATFHARPKHTRAGPERNASGVGADSLQ